MVRKIFFDQKIVRLAKRIGKQGTGLPPGMVIDNAGRKDHLDLCFGERIGF
jgi:hypothetical protein